MSLLRSSSELMPKHMSSYPPKRYNLSWNLADCSFDDVNLLATLTCGQTFRWRRQADGAWLGSIGIQAAVLWQPEDCRDHFFWQTFPVENDWAIIHDYFNLGINLRALQRGWHDAEQLTADVFIQHVGLRLLQQPLEECLYSFQCASCNTVTKIERSVEELARLYGSPIETPWGRVSLFPTTSSIATASEEVLRKALWGYRAPRLIALAKLMQEKGDAWLQGLVGMPYADAHPNLTALPGIGPKLADCVCLFCLRKWEAIPVDTHVLQVAQRLWPTQNEYRSLTPRVYLQIADSYRHRYGVYAGWAQQILFYSELHRTRPG